MFENIILVSSSLIRKQNKNLGEILFSTQNLEKFLFGQSLTIIVDPVLLPNIENLPLIFHPDELGIREILSRGLKISRIFLSICYLRKKKTTNIGKRLVNKFYVKISGQNQTLFEKVNFGKH